MIVCFRSFLFLFWTTPSIAQVILWFGACSQWCSGGTWVAGEKKNMGLFHACQHFSFLNFVSSFDLWYPDFYPFYICLVSSNDAGRYITLQILRRTIILYRAWFKSKSRSALLYLRHTYTFELVFVFRMVRIIMIAIIIFACLTVKKDRACYFRSLEADYSSRTDKKSLDQTAIS